MAVNKTIVFAGVVTLVQAAGQMVMTTLAITQHFCVIDFLKELPILLYIRILYFHNPTTCGARINIGQAIDGIVNQAFVLLQEEPFTAFRTLVINCTNLGLSIFWVIASIILLTGGTKNTESKKVRWPWILVTVCVCVVDLIATVSYANDSFHTRTLPDIMDFIGGTASGIGSTQLNTSWAAWTMVLIYSRLVIMFLLNLFLVVTLVVECNIKRKPSLIDTVQVEAAVMPPAPVPAPAPVQPPVETLRHDVATETSDVEDIEDLSTPSLMEAERIPRPGLSQSFHKMKSLLFKPPSPDITSPTDSLDLERASEHQTNVIPRAGLTNSFRKMKMYLFRKLSTHENAKFYTNSIGDSPERSPQTHRHPIDKSEQKRTVNFPENMTTLPQRLENLIAEQQQRLDRSVVDTAGRVSPPRASQSLPHLDTANISDGRRGTTAGLPGQMPWAYISLSTHRMRDQLPPDEELPPVPLPDYSAMSSARKASVHRAASSLSSLTHKRDYASRSTRPPLTHSDVLY